MREDDCYVKCYTDRKLEDCSDYCWGFLQCGTFCNHEEIYIYNFQQPETKRYQKLLVSLINQITPCSIVTRQKRKYIKFKTLTTYDQTLVLLNFIRNLWYEATQGYTKKFFTALKKPKYKDPMRQLLWANKEACVPTLYSPAHSPIHDKKILKIRTVKRLRKWQGSASEFMTGKNIV